MVHPLGLTPSKIIAVHLNYQSRAAQRGRTPVTPSYFLKPPSSLSADGVAIPRPRGCSLLSFEAEVALVIGKQGRRIPVEDALSHVAYYTAANDIGLYDLRYADGGSNLRSKGHDAFTPVGPRLIKADDIDPRTFRLRAWVNGELAQDAKMDELLFPFEVLIADLSRWITLEPGDIILTGTPAGSHPVQPGDVVEVELDDYGRLRNEVVDEADDFTGVGAGPRTTEADSVAAWGTTSKPSLDEHTRAILESVATATLSAQLRERGLHNVCLEGVRPTRPDIRLFGFAKTLRYVALREDVFARVGNGFNAQKRAVDSIEANEVLVIEARGDHSAGTLGDILALRAITRGATGIITDGALRDTPSIAGLDIPTYYGSSHPAVLGRRHVPMDMDLPITCGGVLVMPGDILVGDAEGVVVIPPDIAVEIAHAAAEAEFRDRFIAEKVTEGASLDGLHPIGAAWRAEYERWRAAAGPSEGHTSS